MMSFINHSFISKVVFALFFLNITSAYAQSLTPIVAASIHDDLSDGVPDYFNTPNTGLLRNATNPTRQDRAIIEFEIPDGTLPVVSAVLNFEIFPNNWGGSQFRQFEIYYYSGNGTAELEDFHSIDYYIGIVSLDLSDGGLTTYDVNVTAFINQAIINEDTHFGFIFNPLAPDNFPSVIRNSNLVLETEVRNYAPLVRASIHDYGSDGIPDRFNDDPFSGLLRNSQISPPRHDRAIIEFDLNAELNHQNSTANLNFELTVNNHAGSQFREFDIYQYSADGVADLADFYALENYVTTVALDISEGSRAAYSVNITPELNAAVENGDSYVGFIFDPIGLDNAPSILLNSNLMVTSIASIPLIITESGVLPAYAEHSLNADISGGVFNVSVSLEETVSNVFVFLYDSNGNLLASSLGDSNETSLQYDTLGVSDEYTIVIYNNSGTDSSFFLEVTAETTTPTQTPTPTVTPNPTPTVTPTPTPTPGENTESVSGYLGPYWEHQVDITSDGDIIEVSASLTESESNMGLFLYDSAGNMLRFSLNSGPTAIIEYDPEGQAGTYSVVFYNNSEIASDFTGAISY